MGRFEHGIVKAEIELEGIAHPGLAAGDDRLAAGSIEVIISDVSGDVEIIGINDEVAFQLISVEAGVQPVVSEPL